MFINSDDSPSKIARRVKAMQKRAAERNVWFYREEIASGDMLVIAALS